MKKEANPLFVFGRAGKDEKRLFQLFSEDIDFREHWFFPSCFKELFQKQEIS